MYNAKVMAVRNSRAYLMNAVLHMTCTCARNITSVCPQGWIRSTLTLAKGTLVLQLLDVCATEPRTCYREGGQLPEGARRGRLAGRDGLTRWRAGRALQPGLRLRQGALGICLHKPSVVRHLVTPCRGQAGVENLVKSYSGALARHGVNVNLVIPGWIQSDMMQAHKNPRMDPVLKRIPSRRWGLPSDFGGIAVYLASEASRYHTGDKFIIDGGYQNF